MKFESKKLDEQSKQFDDQKRSFLYTKEKEDI